MSAFASDEGSRTTRCRPSVLPKPDTAIKRRLSGHASWGTRRAGTSRNKLLQPPRGLSHDNNDSVLLSNRFPTAHSLKKPPIILCKPTIIIICAIPRKILLSGGTHVAEHNHRRLITREGSQLVPARLPKISSAISLPALVADSVPPPYLKSPPT